MDLREVSAEELTRAYLERIEATEPAIRAFVTVTADAAIDQARDADVRIAAGDAAALTGIPMLLKDNLCTRGVETTCSSQMLRGFVPVYDSAVAERLRAAGAVLLGKGNMDEFAMGSSTENSAFHPTHNPWDTSKVPGGSSGGPAAAVSAGQCAFSLGSDTGGSVRQPAALCGVVGVKPTYGLVSRYGLVAFASSLDQIGPITATVEDAATVLGVIAGHDPRDSTSIDARVPDYTSSLGGGIEGMRVGVPKEYFVPGMEAGVEDAVRAAIEVLAGLGATVEETTLPNTPNALAVYYIIAPSEACANLARYDGVKYGYSHSGDGGMWDALELTRQEGFGPEVKRRIMLGAYALSAGYYDAYYLKAQKVRTLIRAEFDEAFEKFDVIVGPTSPTTAFDIGAKVDDPVQMYLNDMFTFPANIAGIPGISVPAGLSGGLPVGLQIMAPAMRERTMLRAAYAYEQATPWHKMLPGV